jgi:hypothetical protein
MRPICTISFAGIMILTDLSFSISGNKPATKEAVADPGFAVVELFTSERLFQLPIC